MDKDADEDINDIKPEMDTSSKHCMCFVEDGIKYRKPNTFSYAELPLLNDDWITSGEMVSSCLDTVALFLKRPEIFDQHKIPVIPCCFGKDYKNLFHTDPYIDSSYKTCYVIMGEYSHYMTDEDHEKWKAQQEKRNKKNNKQQENGEVEPEDDDNGESGKHHYTLVHIEKNKVHPRACFYDPNDIPEFVHNYEYNYHICHRKRILLTTVLKFGWVKDKEHIFMTM